MVKNFKTDNYIPFIMISIRQISYETTESTGVLFSRLKWAIHLIDSLYEQRVYPTDTNKKWIGVLHPERNTFKLRGLDSWLFNGLLPIKIVGKILDHGQKREIQVNFILGSSIYFFFLLFAYSMWSILFNDSLTPFLALPIIFLLCIWGFLIKRKVNIMERGIEELFSVTN